MVPFQYAALTGYDALSEAWVRSVRRPSRPDGKPTRRRKIVTPKRGNAPKAARSRTPSIADLQEQLDRRTRERDEALEQQTATSDVLRVISSSPGDLQPVFEAMLENAVRICDAMGGGICRWDGDALRHVALKWARPAFAELLMRTPIHPNPKPTSVACWLPKQ